MFFIETDWSQGHPYFITATIFFSHCFPEHLKTLGILNKRMREKERLQNGQWGCERGFEGVRERMDTGESLRSVEGKKTKKSRMVQPGDWDQNELVLSAVTLGRAWTRTTAVTLMTFWPCPGATQTKSARGNTVTSVTWVCVPINWNNLLPTCTNSGKCERFCSCDRPDDVTAIVGWA